MKKYFFQYDVKYVDRDGDDIETTGTVEVKCERLTYKVISDEIKKFREYVTKVEKAKSGVMVRITLIQPLDLEPTGTGGAK